jgi:hypothetical protein
VIGWTAVGCVLERSWMGCWRHRFVTVADCQVKKRTDEYALGHLCHGEMRWMSRVAGPPYLDEHGRSQSQS